MAKNKDFEEFASKVFGDYGKDKHDTLSKTLAENDKKRHPLPVDVIVLDRNKNVISGLQTHNAQERSVLSTLSSGDTDRPLTPIDINFTTGTSSQFDITRSPVTDQKPEHLRTRQVKQEEAFGGGKQGRRRVRQTSDYETDNERPTSSSEDSISIDSSAGSITKMATYNTGRRGDHVDIMSEPAYFCVDHMKMCNTRSKLRKHRNCHLDNAAWKSADSRNSRSSGNQTTIPLSS